MASGEFICVLNNDTEVTAGWIESLLAALDEPATGMVGPRSNAIAGLQQIPEAPSMADPAGAHTWAREWASERTGRTWPIDRLIGFCLLARRSTFERYGGFDEGFGIGNYEDDEFGNRLRRSGQQLRVADGSVVLHHGSATFKELGLDYASIMRRAARHLDDRVHHDRGAPAAVVLSDGSGDNAAAAAATALRIVDRVRIVERGALLSTQIAAAAVKGGTVDVVAADWATDGGAREALVGVSDGLVVVVGASERVDAKDWGRARQELERLGTAALVSTPSGSEVRIVPAGPEAVEHVGSSDGVPIASFRFV